MIAYPNTVPLPLNSSCHLGKIIFTTTPLCISSGKRYMVKKLIGICEKFSIFNDILFKTNLTYNKR